MSSPRILIACLCWLAASAAVPARAQPASSDEAQVGPIRCYMEVTRISRLEQLKAKQLCLGAPDAAPARCFKEVNDRSRMTDQDGVQLCAGALSNEPALCAKRLTDTTDLASLTIVNYCEALKWPLVPVGTGGAPGCIRTALDRTSLVDTEAARLCAGSTSAAPVACYRLGRNQTSLADGDVVDLCAPVVVAAPFGWPGA